MKIEHVALWVKNLEEMKAFYLKYFDAKPNDLYMNEKTGFSSYFLSFDSGTRLELMNMSEIASLPDIVNQYMGYCHLAINVGSKEKVIALTDQLRMDSYTVESEPRTTGDGYFESVVLDPDGNRIELTC